MATGEQIKTLIRSHFRENPELFFTTALQAAAHEARLEHSKLAREFRNLVDLWKLEHSFQHRHLAHPK